MRTHAGIALLAITLPGLAQPDAASPYSAVGAPLRAACLAGLEGVRTRLGLRRPEISVRDSWWTMVLPRGGVDCDRDVFRVAVRSARGRPQPWMTRSSGDAVIARRHTGKLAITVEADVSASRDLDAGREFIRRTRRVLDDCLRSDPE
jgi:hypothetical protein